MQGDNRSNTEVKVTANLVQYVVDGRLHRADGPAVITSNGTKWYYWKNVFIEPSLYLRKDTIPATEVLNIRNVEVRRSMIELIGWESFIARANPKVVDQDKVSGAILYRVEMPRDDQDEPLVVVKAIDGTVSRNADGKDHRREYFLRVPPTMKTCKEAIAWTFAMDQKEEARRQREYSPEAIRRVVD